MEKLLKKKVGFRFSPDTIQKLEKIVEIENKTSNSKITKTDVIEFLINSYDIIKEN